MSEAFGGAAGAPSVAQLREWLGDIDIYLFDQIMKGRIPPGARVLDAGCGGGRNAHYFLRAGYDFCGADESEGAIAAMRALAARLAPGLPAENFRVEPLEKISFDPSEFDAVIGNAVLHFASDGAHFRAMLDSLWRVLKPGGIFFARLASSIGLEGAVPLGGDRFRLPDGSDRFLVDKAKLLAEAARLGGSLLEPIKTVNVQNLRCMTTWVMRKG